MAEGVHVIFLFAIALFRLSEEVVLQQPESFRLIELLRERCSRVRIKKHFACVCLFVMLVYACYPYCYDFALFIFKF